jgi:hypothetical protein
VAIVACFLVAKDRRTVSAISGALARNSAHEVMLDSVHHGIDMIELSYGALRRRLRRLATL